MSMDTAMSNKEKIIQALREHASVKGKQKTWVAKLSDEHIYQLFLKIRNNESAKEIARQIQLEWKVRPQSTIHSLSQGILKFQNRTSHICLTPPQSCENKNSYSAQQCFDISGDSLEDNENIARNLRIRINRLIKEEEDTGVNHPYINRDVQTLASLEKIIMKQKEWFLKHPDGDPIRLIRERKEQEKIERSFQESIVNCTEKERKASLKFVDDFMKKLEETAIPLEEGVVPIPLSYEEMQQDRKKSRKRFDEYIRKSQ